MGSNYINATNEDWIEFRNNATKYLEQNSQYATRKAIQNAIDKAKAKGNAENYEAIRYEGYGPSGMAIMIDCLTDNKNRTASFVRSTLTKRGGNLGTDGSVSYLFKRKGMLILDKKYDEDELMTSVLELDIEDFRVEDDGYVIETTPDNFLGVKDELEKNGYDEFIMSEVTYIPDNYIALDEETSTKAMNLIESLEELDDVQEVYHNLEM